MVNPSVFQLQWVPDTGDLEASSDEVGVPGGVLDTGGLEPSLDEVGVQGQES